VHEAVVAVEVKVRQVTAAIVPTNSSSELSKMKLASFERV